MFRFIPVASHHGRLWRKVDGIFVAGTISAPRLNFFTRQIIFAAPNINLKNAVADGFFRLEGTPSVIHFSSMIEQANVGENCSQSVISMREITDWEQFSPT